MRLLSAAAGIAGVGSLYIEGFGMRIKETPYAFNDLNKNQTGGNNIPACFVFMDTGR